MHVTIYSTTSCPYCQMLKKYLAERNIEFKEKLVDQSEEAMKEVSEISGGFLGVPFSVIITDEGKKETVIGFDKGKLEKILGS